MNQESKQQLKKFHHSPNTYQILQLIYRDRQLFIQFDKQWYLRAFVSMALHCQLLMQLEDNLILSEEKNKLLCFYFNFTFFITINKLSGIHAFSSNN